MKLFVLVNLFCFNLYAEIFDTAVSIEPKTYALGFEPIILYSEEKFIGTIHLGYGLVNNIDANFRLGMGVDTILTGLNLGYQLIHNKHFDLSSSFGYHYDGDISFDYFFNLSHDFKYFSVFNGISFSYQLSNEKNINSSYFIGSVYNLENNNKIVIETGVGLDGAYNWISFGVSSSIK